MKIFESDTGVPQSRAKRCAQNPVRAEEGTASQQELQQQHWGAQHADTPLPKAKLLHQGKGPLSHPSLPRVHPPKPRRAGSGMAQSGPGLAQTLATTVLIGGAASSERATLDQPWGFAVRHSLEDLHTELRRVPTKVAAQVSVDPLR